MHATLEGLIDETAERETVNRAERVNAFSANLPNLLPGTELLPGAAALLPNQTPDKHCTQTAQ
jgi:hypothetical protein